MPIKTAAIFLMFALAGPAAWAQYAPLFHFSLTAGPYAVGLKVVEQYDESRIYLPSTNALGKPQTAKRARPLQTLIWYPAGKSNAKPITVGDYANLMMTETSFEKPDPGTSDGWRTAMKPTLGDSMWAVRDARAAPGRFPVFIYAPSFGAMSWENADLCEFLASHGYVVIASTALGANGRDMTADLTGIGAQARDKSWGDQLTTNSHLQEALAILSLNVSLYPDSSSAYEHLGGAYAKAGQKQQAIDNYRQALEKKFRERRGEKGSSRVREAYSLIALDFAQAALREHCVPGIGSPPLATTVLVPPRLGASRTIADSSPGPRCSPA